MLFGELVTLRAFRSDDLAAMNAHANDVETELFSGGAPPTPRPMGDKDYWGRGYGREATRLAVDYAFTMRNVRKVYLDVLANNPRAIAAYTKVGFVEEGRRRAHVWSGGAYVDLVLMGIFRPDERVAEQ